MLPDSGLRSPPEMALEEVPFFRQVTTVDISTRKLSENLAEAGIVVYASSTVGVEAAAAGIPTIYLDLGNALDTDPMSGWDEFKWTASTPKALLEALDEIDGLPPARFQAGSRQARRFALSYLIPVTEEGIRTFLEA